MTERRKYAKTLGFFEPTMFHIHLAYDVKLDDWKNWSDEAMFTFFHEYIHFLQDLTTTNGLYNIYVLDEVLKYDVNYIYRLPKGAFKVPIPVVDSGDNVLNNIMVRAKTTISDNQLNDYERANLIVTGRAVVNTNVLNLDGQQINLAEVTVPTNLGKNITLSADEITESMACLGQKIAYQNELAQGKVKLSPPNYPYHTVEQLASFYSSPLMHSDEFLFTLCDFALMYQHPAKVLVQFLEIVEQNPNITDYRSAIEHFQKFGKNVDGYGNTVSYEDIGKHAYSCAINGLRSRFKGIVHANLRNWFSEVMSKAFAIRQNTPFFMTDLVLKGNARTNPDFEFLMNFIGSPLLSDDNNRTYFYNATKEKLNVKRLARLKAAGNMLITLNGGGFECTLYDYCKAAGYCVNDDCKNSPWKKAKRLCACPYGFLWMGWGLKEYYPI